MKTIKSFVRRGRPTNLQQYALDTLSAGLLLTKPYDFSTVFAHNNPIILEIGFGNGKSLVQMASENPQLSYLGIEVHRAGVGALINDAYYRGLENIKVIHDDATEVLQHIPNDYLSGLQLYFPDPWHKKKHNKRRIVSAQFLDLLLPKLKGGASIHMATDWEEYAYQMLEILSADKRLQNIFTDFSDRGKRVTTKFEERGKELGHRIWDLQFRVVK